MARLYPAKAGVVWDSPPSGAEVRTVSGPARYASFPWYDLPEWRSHDDALWHRLANELTRAGIADVPRLLDRGVPHGVDPSGACLFTQTCGYPLFTTARDHFRVLGAPRYRSRGCEGSTHRSFIVVRNGSHVRTLEDLRGARFAVNEPDSNSGMNLPRRLFAPLAREGRFFGSVTVSGSHAASASAVGAGLADAAAVDCVTYALLERYRPSAVAALRVVGETPASPTPPFVTTRSAGDAEFGALRTSLAAVFADPSMRGVLEAIELDGMDACDEDAYAIVMRYERESAELGYPLLA